MKLEVNVDAIPPLRSSLIRDKLIEAGLPECFGFMVPPLIENRVHIEDSIILTNKNSDPQSIAQDVSANMLIEDTSMIPEDAAVKVSGVEYIQGVKEVQADNFVQYIKKCPSCKYQEICHKLTSNYLQSIRLLTQ